MGRNYITILTMDFQINTKNILKIEKFYGYSLVLIDDGD
jgi:hypothetical protein